MNAPVRQRTDAARHIGNDAAMTAKVFQRFAQRTSLWLKLAGLRARRGNRFAYLLLAACSTLLSACGFLPQPHTVPMPALQDYHDGEERAKRLIVMLPGIYDKAGDFIGEGFVADLHARGIDADVLMPEAHYAYYEARDIDARLEADIFARARTQGYKEIWIVGVSLGGLGSLLYSAKYPGTVAGILLIAPFPGTDSVLAEIRQAGGLLAWARTPLASGGNERHALRWLATAGSMQDAKAAHVPQIFMGTGTSDRLFAGQQMLAELLPATHVNFIEGGHDWTTWRMLWRDFLDNGPWALEAAKQAHLDRIKL
ncbi:MAG: tannase/feruloyl esterase family alpha/beta hydrolase [Rhodocyclales bacterium]|nr:tannase/feruloyl esterase family alpha/beta hydrolase [Rhodocyclales bacterium]